MKAGTYLLATAALSMSACSGRAPDAMTNNVEAASAGEAASMICSFEQSDTKDWSGQANADQSVTVTGKARVGDPKYRAKLFNPQVQGDVARIYVTAAENTTGQAPPDGWWDVPPFTIPDNGSIQTVEIWCGMDKQFARVRVRRGDQTAGSEIKPVPFRGCPIQKDIGAGCLVVKSGEETYDISSAQPRPDPSKRLIIQGEGIVQQDTMTTCVGKPMTSVKWSYTKTKCPIGGEKE